MHEAEEAWVQTSDGELIRQLFGYVPTLHDAILRELRWIGSDAVRLLLDYRDRPTDAETDLAVRLALTWRGKPEVDLRWETGDVLHFHLTRRAARVEGTFQGGIYVEGFVRADTLDVELVKVDPGPDEDQAVRVVSGPVPKEGTDARE